MILNFKQSELKISFRNPIEFINQWKYNPIQYKIRAFVIYLFWIWNNAVNTVMPA